MALGNLLVLLKAQTDLNKPSLVESLASELPTGTDGFSGGVREQTSSKVGKQ